MSDDHLEGIGRITPETPPMMYCLRCDERGHVCIGEKAHLDSTPDQEEA